MASIEVVVERRPARAKQRRLRLRGNKAARGGSTSGEQRSAAQHSTAVRARLAGSMQQAAANKCGWQRAGLSAGVVRWSPALVGFGAKEFDVARQWSTRETPLRLVKGPGEAEQAAGSTHAGHWTGAWQKEVTLAKGPGRFARQGILPKYG